MLVAPGKGAGLIGTAIYADEQPHARFSRYIQKIEGGHWSVDSAVFNWSNRAPLYPRRWFLEEIMPFAEANPSSRTVNGNQDLEKELNCRWWQKRSYRIGVCDHGIFAHNRLDRPDRSHRSQNAEKAFCENSFVVSAIYINRRRKSAGETNSFFSRQR